MDKRIVNFVKYSKVVYSLYFYIGSFLLRLARYFVKTDEKLIVFVSFGGRKYDDSPRCIYEKMIEDPRFTGYRLVWGFMEPQKFDIPVGDKVKIDTIKYYLFLLKARCWITNSSVERGLSFSGKNTFYLNTWHGSAIKKMGRDIVDKNQSFGTKSNESYLSAMLAQGEYDIDVFSRAFNIPPEKFHQIGLPRNDELVAKGSFPSIRKKVCKHLGIPIDKNIILFAPTFREYSKDAIGNRTIDLPINVSKWREQLSDNSVVLFRAHYEVTKSLKVEDDFFWKDVSAYENLNELMIASDMLISDYSSIFFDYSIMEKPMLCFAYDYDLYQQQRGLYFDIRKELACQSISNEEELLTQIAKTDMSKASAVTICFRNKYIESYGEATTKAIQLIYHSIIGKGDCM